MPCPRLAAPLLLALAFGLTASPAAAQNAEAPAKPPIETMPPAATPIPASMRRGNSSRATPSAKQVILPERTIIYLQGESKWDSARTR